MTDTNTGQVISSMIPTLETKEVVDKIAPVETDYWSSHGNRSETKYYLVAKDGTVCNVRMTVYLATKIESDYNGYWVSK